MASTEEELKKIFVKVAKEIYDKGFVSATGGNISARIPGTNKIFIKPIGVRLSDLDPRQLLLLDLEGRILKGEGKPSKEKRFHLGIYKARKDVGAVIHTHSLAITAFAVTGEKIPMITVQAKEFFKTIPVVNYAPPGSRKLAESVVNAFRKPSVKAILLRNHGSVVVGRNLEDAFNRLSLLEETAKTAILVKQLRSG